MCFAPARAAAAELARGRGMSTPAVPLGTRLASLGGGPETARRRRAGAVAPRRPSAQAQRHARARADGAGETELIARDAAQLRRHPAAWGAGLALGACLLGPGLEQPALADNAGPALHAQAVDARGQRRSDELVSAPGEAPEVSAEGGTGRLWELALDTPYSKEGEAQRLGLEDGRIRPCPTGFNPNCVSTSSLNDSYAEPWEVPDSSSTESSARKITTAILTTQKNPKILQSENTSSGYYILVEVDGPLGRDNVELLVKQSNVFFRSLSGKVVYVYPFTTPITDLGAQRKRMLALQEELGWKKEADACEFGVCSIYEDAEDEYTIKREPRLIPF